MTIGEPNPSVRPTGAEAAEYAQQPEPHPPEPPLPEPPRPERAGALLDEAQAAEVLGVDVSRIPVMVKDSLLVPRGERDGGPLFDESDVMAARLLGG